MLAVMHSREPDRVIVARMNVPLIVVLVEDENFMASDVESVLAHTRRVMFLVEGDVADINVTSVTVTGVDGSLRERVVDDIDCVNRGFREGWLRAISMLIGACMSSRRPSWPRSPAEGTRTRSRSTSWSQSSERIRSIERVELVDVRHGQVNKGRGGVFVPG